MRHESSSSQETYSDIYSRRESFESSIRPFAGQISEAALNGSFSPLTPGQKAVFLKAVVHIASVQEFGRTPDELKRKQPDVRGYLVTYDPLRSSIMLKLGVSGIRDTETAFIDVEMAARALLRAYHS